MFLGQKTSSVMKEYNPWLVIYEDEMESALVNGKVVGSDERIFVRNGLDVSGKSRPHEGEDTNEAHSVAFVKVTRAGEMNQG